MQTDLHTLADRRMPQTELYDLCRKAAIVAVRAPYSADDRAECAADILGDIVAECADERNGRTGRPAAVLAYIDRVLSSGSAQLAACSPRRDDGRVQFVALRNRAADWRKSRDRQRQRSALAAGVQAAVEQAAAPSAFDRAAAAMRDDAVEVATADAARRATARACESLGLPTHSADSAADYSATYCALYPFIRDCDAAQAADELGVGYDAYRQRQSRGAAIIRDSHGSIARLHALVGTTANHAGLPARTASGKLAPAAAARWQCEHITFALTDASREAHGRTPILADAARNWREGTASHTDADGTPLNVRPTPHLTAADARRACTLAELPAEDRRAPQTADELTLATAQQNLGRALGNTRGRMPRNAHGRTAGASASDYTAPLRGTFHHRTAAESGSAS